MSENKKIILEMLREGKISVEESLKLLEHAESDSTPSEPKKGEGGRSSSQKNTNNSDNSGNGSPFSSFKKTLGPDFDQLGDRVTRFVKEVAQFTQDVVGGAVGDILRKGKIWKRASGKFSDCDTFYLGLEKEFPAKELHALEIHGGSDKILVRGGSDERILVRAAIYLKAGLDKSVARRVTIDEASSSGTLVLKSYFDSPGDSLEMLPYSIHYELEVPSGISLDIINQDGPVSIHDLEGEITLALNSGTADLRDLQGLVQLDMQEGHVVIKDCSGKIQVSNKFGHTEVSDCKDNINLITTDGAILFEGLHGQVSAHSKNGKIHGRLGALQEKDHFRLHTTNGLTILALPEKGSGSLFCEAPESNIQSSASNLTITAESPEGQTWTLGDGGPQFASIKSKNGAIRLERSDTSQSQSQSHSFA